MAYFARAQSTPVKIARPPSQEEESPASGATPGKQPGSANGGAGAARKDSSQRQCRHIVIYGHCKYQDKGCIFYHPPTTTEVPAAPASSGAGTTSTHLQPPQTPPQQQQRLPPESPVLPAISAQAVNAPVFVPKSTAVTFTPKAPSFTPAALQGLQPAASPPAAEESHQDQEYQDYDESQDYGDYDYHNEDPQMEGLSSQMEDLSTQYFGDPYATDYGDAAAAAGYYAPPPPPVFLRQPLNYHLYTPTTHPDFQPSTTNTHFVPPSAELRQTMQERSEVIRGIAPAGLTLPEELQGYHTLVPLEPTGGDTERRKFGNWYSTVYRAIKASDGLPYVLRRIENYRLMNSSAFAPIEFWSNLKHPGIVSLKEAFTTRAFDDNSLVVVYAYHPNAKTLFETYLKKPGGATSPTATPAPPPSANRYGRFGAGGTTHYGSQAQQQQQQAAAAAVVGQGPTIPERTIWSYIVQIGTAIKRVHESGHALRGLDASKVIVTSQNRVRLSSCGTMDVLMHDVPQDLHPLQQEDLTQFGRLIFALCCGSTNASSGPHFQKSVDHLLRAYGQEIKSLALWLISKQTIKSIDQVLDSIRHRVVQEQEEALLAVDRLEVELQSELENARMVRLMTKLGFINERPGFARDPRWSDTGDRYIIKLFRDYVFHQVDEHGNPVLDMSHVLTCLNKLDAGTDEKLMLVARDEQSCLVVSYKDIKNCMEGAFGELAKAAIASPAAYKHR